MEILNAIPKSSGTLQTTFLKKDEVLFKAFLLETKCANCERRYVKVSDVGLKNMINVSCPCGNESLVSEKEYSDWLDKYTYVSSWKLWKLKEIK